jgi:hypothetical protein
LAVNWKRQGFRERHNPDRLLQAKVHPGTFTNKQGYAYLGMARVLDAQGRHDYARAAARSALEHLEKSVGLDHPDTGKRPPARRARTLRIFLDCSPLPIQADWDPGNL